MAHKEQAVYAILKQGSTYTFPLSMGGMRVKKGQRFTCPDARVAAYCRNNSRFTMIEGRANRPVPPSARPARSRRRSATPEPAPASEITQERLLALAAADVDENLKKATLQDLAGKLGAKLEPEDRKVDIVAKIKARQDEILSEHGDDEDDPEVDED